MTTYVAFSTAWPLRKSNAIALEEHGEHLLDFRKVDDPKTVVTKIFFKP